MFEEDKRFIGEEDAMAYYMKASTKAFADFTKKIDQRDIFISPRAGSFLYGIPEHLTRTIDENIVSGRYSRLKGHFKKDIIRNVSEAVVYNFYAEQLDNTGRISVQVMYDDKGYPIGDAANISKQVVDELKVFDNAYGEEGHVDVDMSKIEFCEGSKQAFVATQDSVKRPESAAARVTITPVQ